MPPTLPVTVEELRGSIHGHDSGLRHMNCGGELYFDWTTTYEYDGVPVPALRCTVCKKEALGDADVADIEGM